MVARRPAARLDVDALVDDAHTRILVCCGSGGVGKTTVACAVALLSGDRAVPLGELALRAGYADQAHLGREFRALAGVSPGHYRRAAPAFPNHLPAPAPGEVNSVQERARAAR